MIVRFTGLSAQRRVHLQAVNIFASVSENYNAGFPAGFGFVYTPGVVKLFSKDLNSWLYFPVFSSHPVTW